MIIIHFYISGAIFTPGFEDIQTAFKFALYTHNQNESSEFQVEPLIHVVESDDPYLVTRQCKSSF